MSTLNIIILVAVIAAAVIIMIVLYRKGNKMQQEREERQADIDAAKQTMSMLIIDKKKMKMKESGLPKAIIESTPKRYRNMKVPVVKAKVGPTIQLFVAEDEIFDEIPVKKEVKATVSGLYITSVRGAHGKIVKPEKQRTFLQKIFGQK